MEIVYYFDRELQYCPVKKYLKQYLPSEKDTPKKYEKKINIFTSIDQKLNNIRQNGGQAVPPISKPLRGYNFFEVKQSKDSNILIRILYFCHDKEKMVLLNAFEKPRNYKTQKEKNRIKKQYNITEKYLNNFKQNPKNYEPYQ